MSRQPNIGVSNQGASAEPDKYVNPYKGGASALDKAAELFFFTEILRGMFRTHSPHLSGMRGLTVMDVSRHVGRGRTDLPAALHYHVRKYSI